MTELEKKKDYEWSERGSKKNGRIHSKSNEVRERRENERCGFRRPRTNDYEYIRYYSFIRASKEPGSNTALADAVCTVGGGIETSVCPGLF